MSRHSIRVAYIGETLDLVDADSSETRNDMEAQREKLDLSVFRCAVFCITVLNVLWDPLKDYNLDRLRGRSWI